MDDFHEKRIRLLKIALLNISSRAWNYYDTPVKDMWFVVYPSKDRLYDSRLVPVAGIHLIVKGARKVEIKRVFTFHSKEGSYSVGDLHTYKKVCCYTAPYYSTIYRES